MMILRSDRLAVEIAEPGAVYRGPRFDWTGGITQVTLDGRHTYCTPATIDPNNTDLSIVNIAGLANEFGIFCPVGYDDAAPGECFPKLGVGLLEKPDDQPYSFARPYRIHPFPMDVQQHGDDAFTMLVHPSPCRGYACRYTKTIRLEGTRLEIHYLLENVGERAILTHEYNHNFLACDGAFFGPDYRMTLPFPITCDPVPEELAIEGSEIRWRKTPEGAYYCRPTGFTAATPAAWRLTNEATGAGIAFAGSFPIDLIALWGVAHTACPEVFFAVDVQPGASQDWTRCYEFF